MLIIIIIRINKAGIINLLAFSMPLTPIRQIITAEAINRKCQKTVSLLAENAAKSAGALAVVT